MSILADMENGVTGYDYKKIADRKEAIFEAISSAEAGDVVLIAGKGHENYQIVGKEVLHFDDKEVALEAIQHKLKLNRKDERE